MKEENNTWKRESEKKKLITTSFSCSLNLKGEDMTLHCSFLCTFGDKLKPAWVQLGFTECKTRRKWKGEHFIIFIPFSPSKTKITNCVCDSEYFCVLGKIFLLCTDWIAFLNQLTRAGFQCYLWDESRI